MRAIPTKDATIEKKKQTKCANCKGPHVASYKGCPEYKKQAFRLRVVNNQKSYAKVVGQNSLPQPKTQQTFSFTAEQLTNFAADMVIQIVQNLACAEKFQTQLKQS